MFLTPSFVINLYLLSISLTTQPKTEAAFLASVIAPRIVTALEGLARTAVRGQRCDARWAGPWPDLLDEEGRDAVRRAARVLLRAQLKGALLTDDRSLLKAFAQHAAAWKASLGSEWKPFITQDVLKTLVDAAKTLEICEDEDYQRWQVVDASRVVASIGVRGDDVAAVVKGALRAMENRSNVDLVVFGHEQDAAEGR